MAESYLRTGFGDKSRQNNTKAYFTESQNICGWKIPEEMCCWACDRFSRCTSPSAFVLCCQSLWAWPLCWHCWDYHQESITGVSERQKRHSQMERRVGGGDLVGQMWESTECWILPGLPLTVETAVAALSVLLGIFAPRLAVLTVSRCFHSCILSSE